MISHSKRASWLAGLLAVPPILLIAALFNKLMPPPEAVPAVVAANDHRQDALQHHVLHTPRHR